mgnify:CR=1 FL=1
MQSSESAEPSAPTYESEDRRWRFGLVSLAIIAAALAVVQLFFRLYSDELVGVALREIVAFKSEGMYRLTYKDLRLNFIGNSLEIDSLALEPDSARFYDSRAKKWRAKNKVYRVSVPEVRVEGTDLLGAYLDEQVNLNEIYFESPHVSIYSQDQDGERDPFRISNLFFLISDRLDIFSIESFDVNTASLDIYHRDQRDTLNKYFFNGISLSAKGFQIDSVSEREGKPFQVRDISVQAQQNSFRIPGTDYLLEVGNLQASTQKKRGEVSNLRLLPVFGELGSSFYEVSIPKLELRGIDFQRAYFEQDLEIDTVFLRAPQTNVFSLSSGEAIEVSERPVYDLVSDYFRSVRVGRVRLDSSSFSMAKGGIRADLSYPFQFNSVTLLLENFFLDSATQAVRKKRFFLDNFDVTFLNYTLQLPDSTHILKADRLTVSSSDSLIIADSLFIEPAAGKRGKYRFRLPRFELRGANLWRAYLRGELLADTLRIRNGGLTIRSQGKSEKNKQRWKDLQQFASDQQLYAKIKHFDARQTNLWIRHRDPLEDLRFSGISARINDFVADADAPQPLSASYLRLSGRSFSVPDRHRLHRIGGGRFRVSSGRDLIELEDLRWKPNFPTIQLSRLDTVPHQMIQDLKIDRIALSDFDLLQAARTGEIRGGTLSVSSPDVTVFRHENAVAKAERDSVWQEILLKNTYLKAVNLAKIEVTEGAFTLVNFGGAQGIRRTLSVDAFNLFSANFRIDSLTRKQDYLFFQSDSLSLHLKDYLFYLSDEQHVMEADELRISSDLSRGYVKNLYLTPLDRQDELARTQNRYKVHVPRINLRGLNFTKLLFRRELELDTLLIPSPYVELRFSPPEKKLPTAPEILRLEQKVRLGNLYDLVKSSLQKLIVHRARVDSLNFRWTNVRRGRASRFNADNIQLEIEEFVLDSAAQMTNERILFADDIRVHVACYEQILPDSTHQLTWRDGYFSTRTSDLRLHNIQLIPLQRTTNRNFYQLLIPELQLRNMRLLDAYTQEALHLDELRVRHPEIRAGFYTGASAGKTSRQAGLIDFQKVDSLYHYLKPFFDRYHISRLRIDSSFLDIDASNPKVSPFFPLRELSINVDNFRLPRQAGDGLFFSDELSVSLPHYRVPLRDTTNQLTLEHVRLSTGSPSIRVDSIAWIPREAPYIYTLRKDFETDWIDARIRQLLFYGLDWKQLLGQSAVDARRIGIEGLRVRAFRDKRRPDLGREYKPMPHDRLTDAAFPIHVDTLTLRDMEATYTEHPEKGARPGVIFFDSLQANLYNISNLPALYDTAMIVQVHTKIMGDGHMRAQMKFPLHDSTQDYTLQGTMSQMNMERLNPLLEPLIAIRINKGIAEKLRFSVRATDRLATGKMLFRYRKLKVKVLNKKRYRAGFNELLASLGANMVIRNRNPRLLSGMKEGEVYFERNQGKSIFNYWAKIFLSGIKSSVGLGK